MISTTDSGRELTVERTDDGSATLYIAALDEHYHSTKGALAESQHVYIDMCLGENPPRGPGGAPPPGGRQGG